GAQFEMTDYGLKNHRISLTNIKDLDLHYDVRYRRINGLWNISSVVTDGTIHNPKYKNNLRHTAEFVSTSITPSGHNPIKESDAIYYTAIYTQQNAKFTEDYWNDTETIARDSTLEKQVNLLFSNNDLNIENAPAAKGLEGTTTNPVRRDNSKKMDFAVRFALRYNTCFAIGIAPVSFTPGTWSVKYSNAIIATPKFHDAGSMWYLDWGASYKLNRSFAAFLNVGSEISQTKDFGYTRIGLN